jgi:hypothetical protein
MLPGQRSCGGDRRARGRWPRHQAGAGVHRYADMNGAAIEPAHAQTAPVRPPGSIVCFCDALTNFPPLAPSRAPSCGPHVRLNRPTAALLGGTLLPLGRGGAIAHSYDLAVFREKKWYARVDSNH